MNTGRGNGCGRLKKITMQTYKFEIGQIVRHKATNKANAIRLVVIGRGKFETADGYSTVYLVSGERDHWGRVLGEALFAAAYISEIELIEDAI